MKRGRCKGHIVEWQIGESGPMHTTTLPDCKGLCDYMEEGKRHADALAATAENMTSEEFGELLEHMRKKGGRLGDSWGEM